MLFLVEGAILAFLMVEERPEWLVRTFFLRPSRLCIKKLVERLCRAILKLIGLAIKSSVPYLIHTPAEAMSRLCWSPGAMPPSQSGIIPAAPDRA
jgi:hypothetical protein